MIYEQQRNLKGNEAMSESAIRAGCRSLPVTLLPSNHHYGISV